MRLEKRIEVSCSRDDAVECLCRDATLLALIPGEPEIIESQGDRRTLRAHYRALGREGEVTFDFEFLMDGNLRFEKRCDGHVWRELRGLLSVEETDPTHSTLVIELVGRTKRFVPEVGIKLPMEQQLEQMATALCSLLEGERG